MKTEMENLTRMISQELWHQKIRKRDYLEEMLDHYLSVYEHLTESCCPPTVATNKIIHAIQKEDFQN